MERRKVRHYGPVIYMTEIEGDFGDEECPRCAAKAAGYAGWELEYEYNSERVEGMIRYVYRDETDAEYNRRIKAEKKIAKSAAKQRKFTEKQERELYERLKQKFG